MHEDATFDVCLSFAGDHREYVREVYASLTLRGVECFFDEPHQVDLWGQDLAERFDEVFRKEAQFCVACVSSEWVKRSWPAHERRSALARMIEEPGYLLPVRFDDTEVPGLSPNIGYLDGTVIEPDELAELITKKVKRRPRNNFLPLNPNRMIAALEIQTDDEDGQVKAISQAQAFLQSLVDLDEDARELAFFILGFGCTCRLPECVHMPIDRIVKALEWPLDRTLIAIRALRREREFSVEGLIEEGGGQEEHLDLCLGWEPRTPKAPPGSAADVANAMIREAGYQSCGECHAEALKRLDFRRTSSMLDWSGDEFEELDEYAAPSSLQDLVGSLLDVGWTFEKTLDQMRFMGPDCISYEFVPLRDWTDPECIEKARKGLEELVYRDA